MAGVLTPAIVFGAGLDTAIMPGQGIGAGRLGMSEAQAVAALGKPQTRLHVSDGHVALFGDLQVFLDDGGTVVRVETDSGAYRTRDGLGVGSTEAEIVAKRGAPARAEDIATRNDNLLMTIGRRLCYEPGLVFLSDYVPRQPRAVTHVAVRRDGCARAFGKQ